MTQHTNNRRNFLKKVSIGSALALTIPEIVNATMAKERIKKIELKKDDVVLFQGDSITDAGRNKDETHPNNPKFLGNGYALLAAGSLLNSHASLNLQVYNKGISGNKVYQLADRWDNDCIALKPNVLSILIGVNDFWHKLKHNYNGTIDIYRNDFKALLTRTKAALPNVKLVIGQPFAVNNLKAVDNSWFPEFNAYREAAEEIAEEFGACFIPYQKIFDNAQKVAPGVYWTEDGVHPTLAGSQLMAQAWLEAIK